MDAVHVIRDMRAAAAVLHPMRLRILEHLVEPDSAAGVARHLRLPRQKVNYHLRCLETRGLVRLVETRTAGSTTERAVQAVARRFVISPRLLGRLAADRGGAPDSDRVRLLAAAAAVERHAGETPPEADHASRAVELDTAVPDDALGGLLEDLRRVATHWSARFPGPPTRRVILAIQERPSVLASLATPRTPGETA